MTDAAELFAAARARLADAPRELLGAWTTPRRVLGIGRGPRIVRCGAVWHLGALLLGDDAVYATGDVVRAREEVRRGFTAASQRERAAWAAAAYRGGVPEGEPVHIGWQVLDPAALTAASAPLALRDGVPWVRWSAAGGYAPLAGYLDDRIALLVHPPERA